MPITYRSCHRMALRCVRMSEAVLRRAARRGSPPHTRDRRQLCERNLGARRRLDVLAADGRLDHVFEVADHQLKRAFNLAAQPGVSGMATPFACDGWCRSGDSEAGKVCGRGSSGDEESPWRNGRQRGVEEGRAKERQKKGPTRVAATETQTKAARAAPDDREKPKRGHELAEELRLPVERAARAETAPLQAPVLAR
jgi:hypothetical protein